MKEEKAYHQGSKGRWLAAMDKLSSFYPAEESLGMAAQQLCQDYIDLHDRQRLTAQT